MCLNCRIMTPLSDSAAELLGVEKRKYLVFGNTLYKTMLDAGKGKYSGYSNYIYNTHTLKCVSCEDRDYPTIEVNGIKLYEGKLKIIKPLPIKYKPPESCDLYSELFEGEIKWQ